MLPAPRSSPLMLETSLCSSSRDSFSPSMGECRVLQEEQGHGGKGGGQHPHALARRWPLDEGSSERPLGQQHVSNSSTVNVRYSEDVAVPVSECLCN